MKWFFESFRKLWNTFYFRYDSGIEKEKFDDNVQTYYEVLKIYPQDVVEKAIIKAYKLQYFPKPADMIELCNSILTTRQTQPVESPEYKRILRQAQGENPQLAQHQGHLLTEAERETVLAELHRFGINDFRPFREYPLWREIMETL